MNFFENLEAALYPVVASFNSYLSSYVLVILLIAIGLALLLHFFLHHAACPIAVIFCESGCRCGHDGCPAYVPPCKPPDKHVCLNTQGCTKNQNFAAASEGSAKTF